ncbi:MAG: S-layer homology domain-containing protein [Gudongella sp.]|nr:S-layer homology domain-containing protein [Gudongella sp.]
MQKKGLALILSLTMILSMVPMTAFGVDFTDIPNNWSTVALEKAVSNGLLKGDNGKIRAEDNLTRAEMATIVNRAFNTVEKTSLAKFSDVSQGKWYYEEMAKAVQMQTFEGSGNKLNPDQNITREEAFVVLARAFKIEEKESIALDGFSDKNMISDWAIEDIAALVSAGYVVGSNGQINPKSNISRAEFAQVMDNLVKTYIARAGEYTTDLNGNVMVNVSGVTLKGMTITGDLIIGDGVGDGEVIIDDTTVTGRVLVRGGGEDSIKIIGDSSIKFLIIAKIKGKVRIFSEKGVVIGEVIIDGKDDVILEGDFNSVLLLSSDLTVFANNTKIKSVLVTGARSKIIVDKDSSIDKILVVANDVKIEGKGKVKEVFANGDNIVVTVIGTKVIAGKNTEGVMAGDKEVLPSKTETVIEEVSTPPSGGGGGGSGGTVITTTGVTLNQTTLTLTAGGATGTLVETVAPANATNKAVAWSSSNEAVATVANGVVTPIAAGTATITVTTVDGSFTATSQVTVQAAADTIINIAAIPGVVTPVRGETPVTTITETAQYTGTVAWTPADATFGASTVYTATITLTAKAGFTLTGVTADYFTVAGTTATNPADSGVVTARFPITEAATIAVTGVSLDQATLTLTAGGATGTLVETVSPANATNKAVTWSSSNELIATVANGVVTPIAAGTATITVTTVDGGLAATSQVTVQAATIALESIAITTPATKLIYTVGEPLDIAGMVVTGTYSDTSSKVETITTANVTGFNSSAPVASQTLTVTVGGKTTTYAISIVQWPVEIKDVTVNYESISGLTIVNINIKAEFISQVNLVLVYGVQATLQPNGSQWRAVVPAGTTTTDLQGEIIVQKNVPLIKTASAYRGLAGDTYITVIMLPGITATSVTANGFELTYNTTENWWEYYSITMTAGTKLVITVTDALGQIDQRTITVIQL